MVKLNAITIGTIIALLSYSCVNCTAKAQGWDLIIPPLRQKAILSEEFTQYRSHHCEISTLQWNQQGTRGLPKDLRICITCFQRKRRCAATNSWIFVKVNLSLLFGGRVFEKPLLFPPDAHHCECRQNSQRDFGEAMPRGNPWRLYAR